MDEDGGTEGLSDLLELSFLVSAEPGFEPGPAAPDSPHLTAGFHSPVVAWSLLSS